ncbi:speckle targeted PIP5K1A-regulated poly(A) polymerase [Larus michahellis]|uniref:speckle targeted PIP5K1A-regulated poly(A) polymerase n=1 Tax=Larus michahellis TaxID=119627 RepID=UPI003D9BC207
MGRATSGGSCGEKREWEDAGGAVDMAGTGNGPGPATDVDTGPGPAVEAGPGLVLGTGTGSGPATDADTGPEADPGPVAGTSTGSCPATEADTGLETDPSSGPDTDAVPDPLPGAGTVPGLLPDPVADPDVESQPRGGFRCRLCQVSAANRPSLAEHLRGKKHQRLRALRAERRAQEQRSLFVTGFARGTSGAELADYFRTYGDVATVVMDKEKGAYAIVELREAAGRERALAEPRHHLDGHRLRVRPREQKGFVYGPPSGRSPRREPLSPARLEQELWQASDVDTQMSRLVELLELSEAERRVRHLLVTLFQEVFTEFFPGCAVLPFGSSVNGFDAHGCDLDLLLDLEPTKSLQAAATRDLPASEDSILSDIDLAVTPAPEVLELVATVLRRCVPGVRRVRAVPTARRPVVKFCHKQSGLAGDISIDNRLALLNTRFLQLCAEADERVRPLVYAVRLWAKQQGLAGNPSGGGPLLNNYALTLLVLFFLQTRSPPVLPTVARLRDVAGDEDRAVVGGWDCSFPRDAASLEPSTNTESPGSLLAQFFHVLGDFDLAGQVISLREGRALPLPSPDVPEGLKLGPFNLQDPFELSHNVAANVNEKTAARFGHCCRAAAKYCRSLQYCRKSSKGRAWGLTRLFQPGAVEPGAGNAGVFLISIPLDVAGGCRQLAGRGPWFWEVCAAIAFVLRDVLKCDCAAGKTPRASNEECGILEDSAPSEEDAEPDVEETAVVGSKRHRSEVTNGSALPGGKKPRPNVPEEAAVANWSCAVRHRVWTGRRRVRRQLRHGDDAEEPEGDSLELEQKVSETIVGQGDAEGTPQPLLQFEASARPATTRRETRVLLRLVPSPTPPGPLFRDFFHFLQSFLPGAVRRRLGWGPAGGTEPQNGGDVAGGSVS